MNELLEEIFASNVIFMKFQNLTEILKDFSLESFVIHLIFYEIVDVISKTNSQMKPQDHK